MKFHRALPLLSCLMMSAAIAMNIYSWRDAAGKIHYSDAPPPDARDVRSLKSPAKGEATSAPTAKPRTAAEMEMDFRKRQNDAKDAGIKAAKEQEEAEQRRSMCQTLRSNLATLQSGVQVARTSEKGEREFIDDTQRAADIEKIRAQLEQACK